MTNLEENTKPKTVRQKVLDHLSSSINRRPSQKSPTNNNKKQQECWKAKKTEDIEWTPIEPFESEDTSPVVLHRPIAVKINSKLSEVKDNKTIECELFFFNGQYAKYPN